MIEIGKYVFAQEKPQTGKTRIFSVHAKSNDAVVGRVKWHGAWRCYAFFPAYPTIFEWKCLRDIADFTERLTKEYGQR